MLSNLYVCFALFRLIFLSQTLTQFEADRKVIFGAIDEKFFNRAIVSEHRRVPETVRKQHPTELRAG